MNVDEYLFCLVSGAPAPPIRVGIARVADRLSVAVLSGCGSAVVGTGLDSMHAPGILHGNTALILVSCYRVARRPRQNCGSRQICSIPLGDSAFG